MIKIVATLSLFYSLNIFEVKAQNDSLISEFYSNYRINLENKITLDWIIGTWYSSDYPESKIEFVREGNVVDIFPQTYMFPYSFNISNNSISASGCAMSWPPFNCILFPIDQNTLRIHYYHLGMEKPLSHTYKKKN